MRFVRFILSILIIAIILPQAIPVVRMGMRVLHGIHQSPVPVETCEGTLPCLSAHQPFIPPATNPLLRFVTALIVAVLVVRGSLLFAQDQWVQQQHQRIRQFLENTVGEHMHAFDALRRWVANGMMSQKITDQNAS